MLSSSSTAILLLFFPLAAFFFGIGACARHERRKDVGTDITLWIDEKQVLQFSSFPMEIFAIVDGVVLPYILDPNFEKYLPIIPSDVGSVNFTWKSGDHKYFYDFDELISFNGTILSHPTISIDSKGKVPRRAKVFQINLHCLGNESGIASFGIGLRIQNDKGVFLPGTPLRLTLKKSCADHGPDPECDKKCANGGRCNSQKICECRNGYMGKYCGSALCYPACSNGGICVSPGHCSCANGYQGLHCEGGICRAKCQNGGRCIQKDKCECRQGYYGLLCEYSKCSNVPCLNGSRCVGVNRCRCRRGYTGKQCERFEENRNLNSGERCQKKCVHRICRHKQCTCNPGWFGRKCSRRNPRHRRQRKLKH